MGIISPETNLHIKGAPWCGIKIENGTTSGGRGIRNQYLDGNGDGWQMYFGGHYTGQPLRFGPLSQGSYVGTTFTLLDNGNVGIGTDAPDSKLHIVQGSSGLTPINVGAGLFIENSGSSNAHYVFQTATIGGGKSFSITNTGNVGIGTITPNKGLEILRSDLQLRLSTGTSTFWDLGRNGSSGHFELRDQSNNLRFLVDKNNGRIGIGESSPLAMVHIKQSASGLTPTNVTAGMYIENSGSSNAHYVFQTATTGGGKSFSITNAGNVGIGTIDPQSKLAVDGQIRATEVKVLADISVPDYVFELDYELPTLKETKEFITENKHLPEIPSAAEIGENGIDLGDMNMRLLKKIEELTLYQIELLEKVEELHSKVEKLENK